MKITILYFSPTGTTKKALQTFGKTLSEALNTYPIRELDFTPKKSREKEYCFSMEDLVVLGLPVYAGRVPNVLKDFIGSIRGDGAKGVAITLFGNRSFDDALVELKERMKENGFHVLGAGAFVGEHSFSQILGKDRPLAADLKQLEEFALAVAAKIKEDNPTADFSVPGELPLRPYYIPKNMEGEPVNFLKAKPLTSSACTDCKLCVELCPMNSINYEDTSKIPGICIKCSACIKFCPVGAKYFEDAGFLSHKQQIETTFIEPKENQWFI
ncbi:MAG: EFR1 family ferrodoxin [Anaerovoracaceae bacterium]